MYNQYLRAVYNQERVMMARVWQSFQSRTGRQKVNPKALDETHQVLHINFEKYLNPMCEQYCRYNPHEAECIVYLLSFFLLFFPFISSVALFSKRRFYILKNSIILMQINTKLPTSIYPSIVVLCQFGSPTLT